MARRSRVSGTVARALWFVIALTGLSGEVGARVAGHPYQILLLSYTGADSPTVSQFVESFRQAMEQRMQAPVWIYQEMLDQPWAGWDPDYERLLAQLLRKKYKGRGIDLVITLGEYPLRFMQARKDTILPESPLLFGLVGRPQNTPVPDSGGVIWKIDLSRTADVILAQNPGCTRIVLMGGSAAADKQYLNSALASLGTWQRNHPKVDIQILADKTLEEFRALVAKLPQDAVAIVITITADATGERMVPVRIVSELSRDSNRPMYGFIGTMLGHGIVGGSLGDLDQMVVAWANMSAKVLRGKHPRNIPVVESKFQHYAFDFREMKRWGISLKTVPKGSIAINREFTTWELYKWYILSGSAVIIIEAGLLAFLLKFIARRRRDERTLRDLSGRLINAQEEERHRIARELHDDINQQLAVLAIELQSMETVVPQLPRSQMKERLRSLWNKTNATSQDLQHISHRLHPSKLEFLGLVGALRGLGNEFKQTPGVKVDVQIRTVPTLLGKDVSLALFRVAQEALHNSTKHSKARNMRMELFVDADDVVLRISDDGVGFDVLAVEDKSLGVLSMEERLRLIGGNLVISSRPGLGTQVEARVPLGAIPMQHKAAVNE
jgi:two-component sensor histidine kinase